MSSKTAELSTSNQTTSPTHHNFQFNLFIGCRRINLIMDRQVNLNIIDKKLTGFAMAAGPSRRYWQEGKIAVQEIIEQLQGISLNKDYPIGRILPTGSIGKGTALRESDIDLTSFINGIQPPFHDYLKKVETALNTNRDIPEIEGVNRSPNAVQFQLSNCGIAVDLVPARNFVERPPEGLRQNHLIAEQHRRALQALENKGCPESDAQKYHSSLSAFQQKFMNDLGDFTAQAVRIAKFWFSSLYIGKPSYGAKTLLELVVAATVMRKGEESHFNVFRGFLCRLVSLNSLKIEFIEISRGRWSLNHGKNGSGYIMDPSNPYNDLLKHVLECPKFCYNLKRAARLTLLRLKFPRPESIIDRMFAPLYLRFRGKGRKGIQIKQIAVHYVGAVSNCNLRHAEESVMENQDKHKRVEFRMTVDMIKKFLTATVNASVCDPENRSKTPSDVLGGALEKVKKMISTKLGGDEIWPLAAMPYGACNMITIPVPNVFPSDVLPLDDIGAIVYGFLWNI